MSKLYLDKAACGEKQKQKRKKTYPAKNKKQELCLQRLRERRDSGKGSKIHILPILIPGTQTGWFTHFLGFEAEGFLKGRDNKQTNTRKLSFQIC